MILLLYRINIIFKATSLPITMKNFYSKSSNLAFKLCLILLIAFIALVYSCKKDETAKLHPTEIFANQPEKIAPAEIVNWVQNLPFKLPTDPAWALASQATINNEFVVKVPVGIDAALFFVKKHGVLQAYTYKWLYEKTEGEGFNGKLDIFNFQTNRLDRLVYKDGDNIKTVALDNAAPVQTPLVQTNQKTNSIDIGRTIARIWCWLTGGTWYDIWNYDFNCVYPDAGPDCGGGGSSSGGGGDWVPPAPGSGDCGPKVAVVGNGKLRVQLLPPGGGCPPGGGDGTYQPYPIPTPTPQTGDHYDAKFVKSVAIVKTTAIINELESQYIPQLGLTDLEKAQLAAKLFDVYKADFNTNFASLQINVDEGVDPPFIAWLRSKLGKMFGVYAPTNSAETQQITNELGAWGSIGQRILQLRQTIGNNFSPISSIILPPLDVSGLTNYPKFKALASDLPNFLKKYPNITKALAYYTGFTERQIITLMQPGKGPKVITIPNLKNTYGIRLYGRYDRLTKTIEIDEGFAKGFELAQSETTIQATGLLLAIITLHEFVHYGRDQNQLTSEFQGYEAGWTFEMNIDPKATGINKNNAIDWINYYPYNFNY
jgi:hypothetical protein